MNVIAVDVGTTSVRLAIVTFKGNEAREAYVLASHTIDISHKQDGEKFEQSSGEIWRAVCDCSKECLRKSNVEPESIKGIGFSATCSLVVVEETVPDGDSNDVIMWMDHRATEQADRISSSGSDILDQFGQFCSPEFSVSKLLWLQENEPQRFASAKGFFELPDWLVFKCLSVEPAKCPRSLCSVVCKWGFNADLMSWRHSIDSLCYASMANQIGQKILGPGSISGKLDARAAAELGLIPETYNKENSLRAAIDIVVGTSLIDAHSGMLAMLSIPSSSYGIVKEKSQEHKIESTFCSLAGTSSCHMILSRVRKHVDGVWGPYKNVVLDGYYLNEAGQSMTGKLIEICIESHEEGRARLAKGETMRDIIASLNDQLKGVTLRESEQLIILPTFHGNRSPLANPRLRGGVYGLTAARSKSLLEYYVATTEALVHEFKLITECMGCKLDTILVSGGLMKNEFYMQTLADIMNCRVVRVDLGSIDFMVMGSAIVARHAAMMRQATLSSPKLQPERALDADDIADIHYEQLEIVQYTPDTSCASYHKKRYRCYKAYLAFSLEIDEIFNPSASRRFIDSLRKS